MGSFCSKEVDELCEVTPNTDVLRRRRFSSDTDHHMHGDSLEHLKLLGSFHDAVTDGNTGMLAYHVDDNPNVDLVNTKYNEETPMHSAVRRRQYKVLQYLLDQGANANALDHEGGDTPLHVASRNGDLKAVEMLCQHNADKSIQNECDESALSIALQQDTRQHRDVAIYLEPDADTLHMLKEKNRTSR
eukprot:392278_1